MLWIRSEVTRMTKKIDGLKNKHTYPQLAPISFPSVGYFYTERVECVMREGLNLFPDLSTASKLFPFVLRY